MIENRTVDIKQNTSDRDKVIEEFNQLFVGFREKNSNVQDLEHFETLITEKITFDNKVQQKVVLAPESRRNRICMINLIRELQPYLN
jgi:hypothetical protein